MKTIAISGASGFVGQSLVEFFKNRDYKIVKISRESLNSNSNLDNIVEFLPQLFCDLPLNLLGL